MKTKFTFVITLLICLFSGKSSIEAICGRADVGAVYAHIDILQSEHTVHRMDVGGVKADATIVLFEGLGFALKPNVILTGSDNGNLFIEGIGFAHVTPLWNCLYLTPSVGVQFTQLKTHFDNEELGLEHIHEHFHSISPYLALEISYTFCERWRICGMYQYSWSRTHTTIKWPKEFLQSPIAMMFPDTFQKRSSSNTQGPSYSAMIEYDITKKWSVNLGAAYNKSLSREKHGLRGYGIKLGTAYWF